MKYLRMFEEFFKQEKPGVCFSKVPKSVRTQKASTRIEQTQFALRSNFCKLMTLDYLVTLEIAYLF